MPRPPELITNGFLAREFHRSTAEIRGAFDRLGIQPAAVAGTVKVYHPDVVRELRRFFNTEDAQQACGDLAQTADQAEAVTQ